MLFRMTDDVDVVYMATLNSAGIPFGKIERPGDWHLRVMALPANEAETIYDLDFRSGRALFFETRFTSSVWLAVNQALRKKGVVQPIDSVRRCCELPTAHPLLSLVEDEAVFRLRSLECNHLDVTHYVVIQNLAGQVAQFDAWEFNLDASWERLLGLIKKTTPLLPRP